jgi:hypothetical protein
MLLNISGNAFHVRICENGQKSAAKIKGLQPALSVSVLRQPKNPAIATPRHCVNDPPLCQAGERTGHNGPADYPIPESASGLGGVSQISLRRPVKWVNSQTE